MIWDDDAEVDAKLGALPAAKPAPLRPHVDLGGPDPEGAGAFEDIAGVPGDTFTAPIHEISLPGFADRFKSGLSAAARTGFENAPLMGTDFTMANHYGPIMEAVNRGRAPIDVLPNPYVASMLGGGSDGWELPEARSAMEDRVWQRVQDLRRTNPGAAGNLPKSRDELLENVHAEQRTAEDYSDQLAQTSGGPINRYLTPFAGQTIGQTADPENIMALALGGPATQSVVRSFLQEGAINAGVTLATLPFELRHRAEIGRPLPGGDAALEVVGAGLIGGSVGAGGKLAEKLLGRLAAMPARHAPDVPPSVRSAATAVEDAVHRAQDNPFADDDTGRDAHRASLLATTRAMDERNPAGMPAEGGKIVRGSDISLEAAQRVAGFQIQARDPRTVSTDADTMQYKGGADAKGVTDRLAGVESWDPAKAGLSLWYERADGKVIVADGHQRLGLAQRVSAQEGGPVPYFGVTYREADGVTSQQMRAIAALKNIAEGSGSAVDAARVLRDAPDGVKQLPPRSPLVRQARDLMALGDDSWGMVVNGQASERDAGIVGRHVKDPAMQTAILGHLAKDSPDTATEAELFVRQALAAGAHHEIQDDMFGGFLKADLILPQRVKILTAALSQLRKDKALFATLTDKAAAIAAAGNKLNTGENIVRQETAARAFATIAALAERKGPISDALQQAAQDAARTGDRRTATKQFLTDVRGRLERGELDGEPAGGAVGPLEPEAAPGPVPARDTAERELALFSDPVGKPEAFAQQTEDLAREIAPDPRYSLAEVEPTDISKGDKGDPFTFLIKDNESGTEIGSVYGNYSDADKHLHIESIFAGKGRGTPGALGSAATRQLLDQLRARFPDAETIGGERISGARGKVDPFFANGPEVKIKLHSKDASTAKPEFGVAQAEIEALERLPQDAEFPGGSLFGKGDDTSITVKDARAAMERDARAVERLRGCVEGGE
jgi:hypothetical protein